VSRFIVPEKLLDVSGWRPLTYGDDRFYAAREGATTLLAQREHGEWQLLAARASLEQLLAFAELHEAELAR